MNRRPSDEQLGQMLKTPHFGKSSELPSANPITPTPMVLTLDQIKPYDRNPRRERNPCFDDIKESIRAQGGLNNPITVTCRPGETTYMVESGGNTRLQILNELYKELGDDTFYQIHVLYQPWKSETHVLTAHLIENEKRGDMLFIDKALAVRELKEMFEETEQRSFSLRKLTEKLKETGFKVDSSVLSRMDYTVDILLPLIPEALRAGMGKPQIERIRKIEKAFQHYWSQLSNQDATVFEELFSDCLIEYNRPEWDSNALRNTLEERIAELLQVPVRTMRLDIDALLHGRTVEINPPPKEEPTQSDSTEPEKSGNEFEHPDETVSESAATQTIVTAPIQESNDDETAQDTTVVTYSAEESPDTDSNEWDEAEPPGIAQTRRSAYESAHELASHYQLEQCVLPSFDWGLGFLIDLPEQALTPEKNQHLDLMQRQWVWWMLFICSEETARPERIPNIPESMTVRRLYLESNQNELMRLLGQPAWISLAYQLLADPLFSDNDFHTLMALIRHCRTLRQQIEGDNDDPLWLEKNNYAST